MKQHINVVGYLYIGLGALRIGAGLLAFLAIIGGGLISGDPTAMLATTIIAPIVTLFLVALGIPGIIGGYALMQGKSWARYLVMFLAVFNLLDFPIGTFISVYTFWALLHSETLQLFDGESKFKTQMAAG
jgi:hypothetical protein